jgi:hypothetical protein
MSPENKHNKRDQPRKGGEQIVFEKISVLLLGEAVLALSVLSAITSLVCNLTHQKLSGMDRLCSVRLIYFIYIKGIFAEIETKKIP